jgi:ATP-dependent Clp protease protease subunit
MRQEADLLDKIDGSLAETYAAASKKNKDEILDMMAAETWLTADESVEVGFASRVAESAPKDCVDWNLQAYARAPTSAVFHQKQEDPAPDPEPVPAPEPKTSRGRYEAMSRLLENFTR